MSNIHTPSDHVKVVHQVAAAITAAAVNGAAIDCLGFEDALIEFYAAPTGTGTTSIGKLQESADGSTNWLDVAGGVFTIITTAGGAKLYVGNVKLSQRLRYIRVVQTGAGGSAAGVAYATVLLLNGRYNPVSQANDAVFSV